jgi:hypothetical protein
MTPTPNSNTIQHQSLLSLLQGTEGIDWSQSHQGWDDTTNVCDWEGISCGIGFDTNENHLVVTKIHLPNSGLSGTLPSQLGLLSHLQEIDLRGNLIRGSIPNEISRLTQLELLDLTDCQLEGTLPQHWSSDKLNKLLLGHNSMSGMFFRDLTSPHLASITEIDLAQNKLEGTLHGSAIQLMANLETLSLSQNRLSGLLPGKELGSLFSCLR